MFKALIMVDGSATLGRAIEAMVRQARESTRLEVTLLHVCGCHPLAGEPTLDLEEGSSAARAYQARVLEHASALGRRDGLQVRQVQASIGMVAQAIIRAAEAAGLDQIVIGAYGMKCNRHYPLGAVAQKVLQLASVLVMLVR